jgi:L-ribulose-5-phosphate 4-epimerase
VLYEEVRKQVCDIAKRMQRDGLVKLTSGNVSARIPGTGFFAITPSGMEYETLVPSDVCVCDISTGKVIHGHRRPSSELPLHKLIMERRPDVNGIVHTHSIYASAFACLAMDMPVISTELAALVGGTIKCAPYARSGTEQFAEAALESLTDGVACLFQNHGALAVGPSLKMAYSVAVGLEEAAMIYHLAKQMGDPIILPDEERTRLFREFRLYYGQPKPGQEREPVGWAKRPEEVPLWKQGRK